MEFLSRKRKLAKVLPFTNSCWSIKLEKNICQYWGEKISSKRIFKEESWKGLTLDVHQIQSNFCINSVNWVEKFSPVVFKITPYLSALDFGHSVIWNFQFDKLIFFPSLNLIFTACVACKNPVQTWKKIQFIKLEISNLIMSKQLE